MRDLSQKWRGPIKMPWNEAFLNSGGHSFTWGPQVIAGSLPVTVTGRYQTGTVGMTSIYWIHDTIYTVHSGNIVSLSLINHHVYWYFMTCLRGPIRGRQNRKKWPPFSDTQVVLSSSFVCWSRIHCTHFCLNKKGLLQTIITTWRDRGIRDSNWIRLFTRFCCECNPNTSPTILLSRTSF